MAALDARGLTHAGETMSHASMTLEARRGAGITDKTLRVSVGIEHPDDLIADMRQALEA